VGEKIPPEQMHERLLCGFTHVRVAIGFVVFCGWILFLDWKNLDRPVSQPGLIDVLFYILVIAVYVPLLMRMFRCFSERFVIGLSSVHMAMAIVSHFVPGMFDPVEGLVGRIFLVLGVLAFLMSANMLVQAVRNPYVAPPGGELPSSRKGLLIVGAVLAITFLLGLLLYLVPLP